jgi:hypothetical protein
MKEVQQEAQRRTIELLVLPTAEAIKALQQDAEGANAILHVTIGVGIGIAHDPLHRPGRALISASGSYLR